MGCTMGKKQKGEEGGKEPPYGTKEPQEAPGEGTKETGENAAPEKDGEVAHLDAKVDLDPLLETQTEENAGQPTKPSVSEDIDPNTGSQPVHSTAAQDTEARGAAPDEEEPIPYVDSNVESATTRTTITKVSTTGTPEDGVTAESVTVTKTTVIKTSHTVEKNEDKPEESSLEPDKHKPVDNEVIVTKTTVTKTFERTEGDDKPTEIITTKTIDTHVEDKPKDTPATGEPEEPQPCHTSPPVVEYAEKPENEPVEAESCSRPEPIVEYAEKPESEPVEAEPSDTSPPVVESLEKPEAEPEAEPCYTKTTVVEIVEEKHEKPESEPVEAEPCVVSPPDVECLEETKPEAEPCYTKTTVVEIVEEKHEKSASEQVEAEPCDTSPPVVEAEPEAETSYTKTTVVEIVEEKPGTETRITTVDHEEDTPVDTSETAVPEEHASDAPDAPVVVSTGPEPIDLSSLPEGLAERLRAIDAAEAGDGVVRTTRTTVTTTRVVGGDGEVVGHTVTETEKKEVVQAGGEEQVVVESHTVTEEDISQPVAEDGGVDPAAQGAQSEDRFYNNKSFQKPDIDPSDSQQQDAALKIQTKYRQHHAKQEVQKKREEKAATTIQATYRGHTDRQKVKDIKEGEAAEEAAEEEKVEEPAEESKPEEEVDIDLADPDVQAAATKIQASFRGHKARQEVKELKEHAQPAEEAPATEEPKEEESTDKEVVDIDLNDPQVAAAATKIQAGVRGYMARKEVHKMKGTTEESQEVTSQEITSQEVTSAEAEEEVDIDLEDPEVAAAAAKIQAKFRGLQLRKGFGRKKDDKPEVTEAVPSKQEVTLPKPESSLEEESQSKKEEEEEIDIDLEDPEVAAAAAKIQAKFRGHKLKKTFGKKEDKQEVSEEVPSLGVTSQEVTSQEVTSQNGTRDMARQEEEEIDIDLDDPEVAAAAAKIQAKFRGHMSKKGFGRRKEPNTEETQEVTSQDEKQEVTSQDEKQEVTSQDDKQEVTVQEDKQEVTSAEQETTSVEDEGTADVKGEEVKDSTTEETPQEVKEEGEDEGKEPEEEVDIDLNDPDVQAAATKIQAGFRGHMTRKEMTKQKEEQGEAAPAEGQEAEGQEGEATDINLEDPEVIAAATKIQAAVRGHHARQEVQVMKDSLEEAVAESQEIPPAEKEEEVDVDLNDPAVNQAATKIQAGFRGYKARQEVQTLKDSKSPEGGAAEAPPEVTSEAPAAPEGNQPEAADEDKKEEVDIDLNDPEVAQAATKIQAAFKGHLVRKDMKDKEGKEETTADAPAEGEVTENKEGDQGEV